MTRFPLETVIWVWLAGIVITSAAAIGGLWLHHRRFVSYHRRKGLAVPLPSVAGLVRELRDFVVLGWWHLRAFLRDGLRTPRQTTGRPVICVHGYTQNATNFWALRHALERRGRPTIAISMWYRLAPLRWYARRLERRLEHLVHEVPEGVDIVAHSMGGIVLRMVLSARADLRERIRTVVTLGSPHHGTAAARGIPLLPEVRALRRRSELLAALPHLPELLPHARIVTVAGTADTIVYPVSTSLVDGAEAVVLQGIGHAGLLTRPRALAAVRVALR